MRLWDRDPPPYRKTMVCAPYIIERVANFLKKKKKNRKANKSYENMYTLQVFYYVFVYIVPFRRAFWTLLWSPASECWTVWPTRRWWTVRRYRILSWRFWARWRRRWRRNPRPGVPWVCTAGEKKKRKWSPVAIVYTLCFFLYSSSVAYLCGVNIYLYYFCPLQECWEFLKVYGKAKYLNIFSLYLNSYNMLNGLKCCNSDMLLPEY